VLSLLCDATDRAEVRAVLLERAALPVRMGGLGVGDHSCVAAAGVVASWADAAVHCHRVAVPALADLAGALQETDPVGPAAPAGAQVDTRAWPGAPRAGAAAAAGAAGALPAADATPSGRRPLILPGLLAAVAVLNAACGAAPAPPLTVPELLALPADAHIAATGFLRVAGGTRLSWARLLGGARAPSQRGLARPVHLAALERLRASLPDNTDLAQLAACHGSGAGLWLSALSAPGRPFGVMGGRAMRLATRLWLGVPPVSRTAVARRCARGAAVDAYGVHFLAASSAASCISNATFRHNALVARTADTLHAHPQ